VWNAGPSALVPASSQCRIESVGEQRRIDVGPGGVMAMMMVALACALAVVLVEGTRRRLAGIRLDRDLRMLREPIPGRERR
jgi:hypothetical protein